MRRDTVIKPIIHQLNIDATPVNVYRSLTSQTELRGWWAPRVIMSKQIVSMEEGKDILMQLLQSEKNTMVRYGWRPFHWASKVPDTVITFEIEDLGVSRNKTGEGIILSVIHDGWIDKKERDKHEKIIKSALKCLKEHLEGRDANPWWESLRAKTGYRRIKLTVVKHFTERIDRDNRGKPDKKNAARNILKLSQALDSQGLWFIKDNGNEIDLRKSGVKIIGFMKNGNIFFSWRDLEKIIGNKLIDFVNRLSLEQNIELHIGKSRNKIPANLIYVDLLLQWCIDLILIADKTEQV